MITTRNSPIQDLLKNEIEPILQATSVLSRLWRLTLFDCNINYMRWGSNLDDYVSKCKEIGGKDASSNSKGNLGKALAKDDLSWTVFCKGISILVLKNPKFVVDVALGEKKHSFAIPVPFTAESSRGDLLAKSWKEVKEEFPDQYGKWDKLITAYGDKQRLYGYNMANSLRSNLTATLKKKDIMWTVFSRGLEVMAFDSITFKLTFEVDNGPKVLKLTVS